MCSGCRRFRGALLMVEKTGKGKNNCRFLRHDKKLADVSGVTQQQDVRGNDDEDIEQAKKQGGHGEIPWVADADAGEQREGHHGGEPARQKTAGPAERSVRQGGRGLLRAGGYR